MPIADRASEAAAVKRRLTDGGTILVVGGRSTNFPQALRAHPRVHFWDSTDPKIETREMPENVRVIICTRFINHAVFSRVQRYATSRHSLMLPGLNSTGEIKDVIAMALDIPEPLPAPTPPPLPLPLTEPTEPPPDETPEPDDDKPRIRHEGGNYRAFLREHANLDASPSGECARLMPAIQAAGFTPTEGAVKQMLYILRRERDGLSSKVQGKPTPWMLPKPAPSPPPSNIAEALRLIDDVALGLGLVREAVLKVQSDDEQMKATMAALRGFLSNPQPANGALNGSR